MYFTIYKITNLLDEKFYLGMHKTDNLNDGYFGSGTFLKRAINKHGIENFKKEILFSFDNPEEMYQKEIELVTKELVKNPMCYNLTVGGWGGNRITNPTHPTWSSEHGRMMGLASSKQWFDPVTGPVLRAKFSEMLRERHKSGKIVYDTFTGKSHTESTKRLIGQKNSINQMGAKNSQAGTKWITDGISNKKIKSSEPLPFDWKYGRV